MNGQNLVFRSDPVFYIRQRAINNVAWFMRNQTDPVNQGVNAHLGAAKEGSFDLQGDGQARQVIFVPVGNVTHGDQPISAYWCPFIQGNVLPGFVDVPRQNPQYNFAFTAAMNGCALVVTHSPRGANMMRIYHNQHPDSVQVNQMIQAQGQAEISRIVFRDYGDVNQRIPAPNAFNFLYYQNGQWMYVLQPQTLDMVSHDVALNPAIKPVVRPVIPPR